MNNIVKTNFSRALIRMIPDSIYLRLAYRYYLGKWPNLRNPKTYNEKIQWLKLHDRNPNYISMVDKYEAKKYIANIVGDEYLIKTLGVWSRWNEIDFSLLPSKFVLKTTHDSGGVVVVTNKKTMDYNAAKDKIEKSLKHNFYYSGREWPYKGVHPRIIAEEYIEDDKTKELRDYKFFIFNGKSRIMFVASDRQKKDEETKFDFFDMDYNWLPIKNGHPNSKEPPKKPAKFELMKSLSEKLGVGFRHIRVDFYEANDKVYVGELTFYHWSGLVAFEPEKWDRTLGDWMDLSN